MTDICLFVVGIFGAFCASDKHMKPIGECVELGIFNNTICVVEQEDLPVRLSYYDPFIETESEAVAEIQCEPPCHLLGDGTPVEIAYDWTAACPYSWYGRWLTVPAINKTVQCRDTGGAIEPTYRFGQWFITIDYLQREREWYNYQLFYEWEISDVDWSLTINMN